MKIVRVRWFDGYFEEFEAKEVRVGNAHLWVKLENGERWMPNHQIRWFEIVEQLYKEREQDGR